MLIRKRIKSVADLKSLEIADYVKRLERRQSNQRKAKRSGQTKRWQADIDAKKKLSAWEFKKNQEKRIYIIVCGECFKVGIANDPYARLIQIQTGNPLPCRLHAVWNPRHAPSLEKKTHAALRSHHVRGEWFKASCIRLAVSFIASQVGHDPIFIHEEKCA